MMTRSFSPVPIPNVNSETSDGEKITGNATQPAPVTFEPQTIPQESCENCFSDGTEKCFLKMTNSLETDPEEICVCGNNWKGKFCDEKVVHLMLGNYVPTAVRERRYIMVYGMIIALIVTAIFMKLKHNKRKQKKRQENEAAKNVFEKEQEPENQQSEETTHPETRDSEKSNLVNHDLEKQLLSQ